MTFENFKKDFEIWQKIETPEKLEVCKKKYKEYLLHEDDKNYFEPINEELENNFTGIYEQNLHKILGLENISPKQIYFFIQPSFTPESLLIIDASRETFTITYKLLESGYWKSYRDGNNSLNVPMKFSESKLDSKLGNNLFNLLEDIITEAREPKVPMFTLDGVQCSLIIIKNGKRQMVKTTEDEENCKSGKVIRLLYFIIDNIDLIDKAISLKIEEKINEIKRYGS